MSSKKVLCVYHGNCVDGFSAAWVVRKFYRERYPQIPIEFLAGQYQNEAHTTELFKKVGSDKDVSVIIVDFSYSTEVTIALCANAGQVVNLDHHASAIERLQDLSRDNFSKVFTTDHSGAMITWNYFFPYDRPPKLLCHVEDRDLWKFLLPMTREIQANLFSYPYNFELYDRLMAMDSEELEIFATEGRAIERKHFKDIEENLNTSVRWMQIGGVSMPVINCPKEWGSDAGNKLCEFAENGIAAYYWDSPDGRNFGLRSIGNVDCVPIATQYGGGGHKNAAGFKLAPHDFWKIRELGDKWSRAQQLFKSTTDETR